jgi:hypothetical protein
VGEAAPIIVSEIVEYPRSPIAECPRVARVAHLRALRAPHPGPDDAPGRVFGASAKQRWGSCGHVDERHRGGAGVAAALSDLSVSRVLWRDILRDRHIRADNGILRVSLDAYEVVWLKPSHG